MKYKYFDKGSNRLIAESDSPIQFNVARFPIWKNIKPVIEEDKEEVKVKSVKAKAKKKARFETEPNFENEENKEEGGLY